VVASADGIQRLELDELYDVHKLMAGVPRTAGRLMNRLNAVSRSAALGLRTHGERRSTQQDRGVSGDLGIHQESSEERDILAERQRHIPDHLKGIELV
jgi:hypothetical protein